MIARQSVSHELFIILCMFICTMYIGSFRNLVDINFICAMGPPGGGRNPITPRLSRHFNYLAFTELEDDSKYQIFSAIIYSWMSTFPDSETLIEQVVKATIDVYSTITTEVSRLLSSPHIIHQLMVRLCSSSVTTNPSQVTLHIQLERLVQSVPGNVDGTNTETEGTVYYMYIIWLALL